MGQWTHLYKNARWRKARLAFLAKHPLCVMCRARGVVRAATVVDHKQPHKGDLGLFWDEANWQSLCASDHSASKQSEDRTGVVRGCDESGAPFGRRW